jgi:hypothetical protein
MAPRNLKLINDRVGKSLDLIRSLGRDRVLVGIPAENALRKPEPGEPREVNNAMLGFIHENGSPARNIPARPFLVPGVRDARAAIAGQLGSASRATLAGKSTDADRTLHAVGLIAQNAVRKRIVNGPFEPLKPKTLAARRRKGRTGTKPLIDTGQLKNSITYVVRDE